MLKINKPHIPDFTNPLGLLVHCHERIEMQLEVLERSTEILLQGESRCLRSVFDAIDAACAHFAVPGVKHTEDEEISLFPRLRERGGEAQEALAAMAELQSQHRCAEQLHTDVDELVRRLPRDGSADPKDLDEFGGLVAGLTALYRPHILLENNFVFPIAARLLSTNDIHELGAEMHERRKDILARLTAHNQVG